MSYVFRKQGLGVAVFLWTVELDWTGQLLRASCFPHLKGEKNKRQTLGADALTPRTWKGTERRPGTAIGRPNPLASYNAPKSHSCPFDPTSLPPQPKLAIDTQPIDPFIRQHVRRHASVIPRSDPSLSGFAHRILALCLPLSGPHPFRDIPVHVVFQRPRTGTSRVVHQVCHSSVEQWH
jgi:hypothetical protein